MRYILFLTSVLVLGLSACNRDNNDEEENDQFDRSEMLKNYAENLVIPAYSDLKDEILELETSVNSFNGELNEENLNELKSQWENTYISFQYANAFNFGPAGAEGINKTLLEEIGTFPVSTSKIEDAVISQNFSDFNRDARGFLAIEYLIFNDNVATTLSDFENQDRKDYLLGLVNHAKGKVNSVLNDWNGSYKNEFISNDGTDAGSSTSLLYNEFVKSFESIKNIKIELPLGKRPGQIEAEPQLVEAFYSGKSLTTLINHLEAIEKIYHGKNKSGVEGIGLINYLRSVEGGEDLVASTLSQWEQIMSAYNDIDNSQSLAYQVENNPTKLEALRVELQKHTRFFKSDMSSLLGIAITFSSGDGD